MLKKLPIILEASRIFSLPMTIFSWLVIFVYSLINAGNLLYGLLALFGICFAHLGANVLDDYIDYKILIKSLGFNKDEYLKHSQKTKCRYIIEGKLKEKDVLQLALTYLFVAFILGVFLSTKCGIGVIYYALIGAAIALIYPIASRFCLSEILIGIAFGPALFGGVYYVMCGTIEWEVFLISLPIALITIILLYIHTIMDYKFDKEEGKKTLANIFSTQEKSLAILKTFIILTYISILPLCIFDILDWQVFLVLLTIPHAIDLYNSMQVFTIDNENIPEKKWLHFPMENIDFFAKRGEGAFMFRMLQARNLSIYFSILFTVAIILGLAL